MRYISVNLLLLSLLHFLHVSVLSVYCRLYIASYHKWYKESALIVFMYADVIWDLKINVSERKYLNYQQNLMMKEVTVIVKMST